MVIGVQIGTRLFVSVVIEAGRSFCAGVSVLPYTYIHASTSVGAPLSPPPRWDPFFRRRPSSPTRLWYDHTVRTPLFTR